MSLHQVLKERTDLLHRKLERELDLMREDLSLEDYIEILKRFYGFYNSLEERFDFKGREKKQLLINDLEFLGVEDLSQIPHFNSFPLSTDRSFEWGLRYVIEGSTLGGMVLSPHFKEKLNLSENGVSFFSGYGPETPKRWREFLVELETFGQTQDDLESACRGAEFTFSSLYDWLIPQ